MSNVYVVSGWDRDFAGIGAGGEKMVEPKWVRWEKEKKYVESERKREQEWVEN